MKDDWDKLTLKQRLKVQGMTCNDWEDIKVFIKQEDTRDRLRERQGYPVVEIHYKRSGVACVSTISLQVNGRER